MSDKIQQRGTLITMDWGDSGAVIKSNVAGFNCPRCSVPVEANAEHRCGDKVPKPKPIKRVTARAKR